MRRFLLIMLLLFPLTLVADEMVSLTGLNIQPSATSTRFTFILSGKTYGKVKYLPNPDRVVVELANTSKHFDIQHARLGGANVTSINAEEAENGVLRFTFYVTGKVKWTIQLFENDKLNGTHLQLDIISIETKNVTLKKIPPLPKPVVSPAVIATAIAPNPIPELPIPVAANISSSKEITPIAKKPSIFIIVIDAGHGGRDSGARGQHGLEEKNIVLGIAKKLAAEINQKSYLHAVLTRNGDYFVPLRERLKLARKGNADLFIAVHADAYYDNSAAGVSVYVLSQHGASSEAARWLAQRENYSELGGVELNALPDADPILRSVLVDLAQTATMRDSLRLGTKVLDALDNITSLHYTHVEHAPFVVLKSPDIPSILVETGFITNPSEEARLNDPVYQDQIAHALFRGINKYVRKYGAVQM